MRFLGVNRRARRDQCETLTEWFASWPGFCDDCCAAWSLPARPLSTKIACLDEITIRLPANRHTLDETPEPSWPDWIWEWGSGRVRVTVLVDNQAVANLLSGSSFLYGDSLRAPFVRMARSLQRMHATGTWPRYDRSPYVSWVPRRFNSVADHLANIALDDKECYSWQIDVKDRPLHHTNLVLASDGGFRRQRKASSCGWALWSLDTIGRQAEMLAFGYSFWTSGKSAFEAEVLGLECALNGFCTYCNI